LTIISAWRAGWRVRALDGEGEVRAALDVETRRLKSGPGRAKTLEHVLDDVRARMSPARRIWITVAMSWRSLGKIRRTRPRFEPAK